MPMAAVCHSLLLRASTYIAHRSSHVTSCWAGQQLSSQPKHGYQRRQLRRPTRKHLPFSPLPWLFYLWESSTCLYSHLHLLVRQAKVLLQLTRFLCLSLPDTDFSRRLKSCWKCLNKSLGHVATYAGSRFYCQCLDWTEASIDVPSDTLAYSQHTRGSVASLYIHEWICRSIHYELVLTGSNLPSTSAATRSLFFARFFNTFSMNASPAL